MSGERIPIEVDDYWPEDATEDEGVVANWFKREGSTVREGEAICELQVEKVSFDVHAPVSGELVDIELAEDDEFSRGDVLAWIHPG